MTDKKSKDTCRWCREYLQCTIDYNCRQGIAQKLRADCEKCEKFKFCKMDVYLRHTCPKAKTK